ncbi:MAG: hypothetical protein WC444_07585 [Candidatus Paceibacterota bacterium]
MDVEHTLWLIPTLSLVSVVEDMYVWVHYPPYIFMEQLYCEYFSEHPDYTYQCSYRLDHRSTCMYSMEEQKSMEQEGVFCPFWQFKAGGWVDMQYFCEVQHGT